MLADERAHGLALKVALAVEHAVLGLRAQHIGERSAHTWFVLHELLDLANVKNYDGSWTEYGSLVGVPIELGEAR